MTASEDTSFAQVVSLACHDLRTPLATISGFAKTLTRMQDLGEPLARYLGMIEAASDQLAELLDDLGVAARIESGRYDPPRRETDTLELARGAAERFADGAVAVEGPGGGVSVDVTGTERAVYNLARCAIRHGGIDRLTLHADEQELRFAPIAPAAAAIVTAEDLRDLGAAVAGRVIEAQGGDTRLDGETLVVRLPR